LLGCLTIPEILSEFFLHAIPIISQFALCDDTNIFFTDVSKKSLECSLSIILIRSFLFDANLEKCEYSAVTRPKFDHISLFILSYQLLSLSGKAFSKFFLITLFTERIGPIDFAINEPVLLEISIGKILKNKYTKFMKIPSTGYFIKILINFFHHFN